MEFTLFFLRLFLNDILYAGPILGFLLLVIALVGYVIGRLEGWSAFDSLYHAFINATTVGYGDFRPSRKGSKILAILLALVGLIFTGMVVAIALHAANFAFAQAYDVAGFGHRL
jgi:voltage-gated potassium channel Kch